jgi:CRP-like cAMP-binding protein
VTTALADEFAHRFPAVAADLGPENLARLLDACSVAEIPLGRRLFRERMPVESIYLVLDGELEASVESTTGGRRANSVVVGRVGPGDWLGEVAVLSGEMVASSTVTTVSPCRLLKMHHQDFDRLVLHDADISHVLLGLLVDLLARRLAESTAMEASLG